MGDPGPSKTRSIRSALLRLGRHTTRQQIVAELVRHGLVVSEEQVERVRIDLLKDPAEIRRRSPVPRPDQRRAIRSPRVPGFRR
jgi:hypothetical protein